MRIEYVVLIQCPHLTFTANAQIFFFKMHVPIFYEKIHHSHLLFGRVWSRRIWLSWHKTLFILLRYNPQRSSHTDKIRKVWQCIKLQWKSRRATQNIPIILWGYLSLIPVLLWMYSPNSLLLIPHSHQLNMFN